MLADRTPIDSAAHHARRRLLGNVNPALTTRRAVSQVQPNRHGFFDAAVFSPLFVAPLFVVTL